MKIKGRINLLCATESGVSKATGNKWSCKDVVIEMTDDVPTSTLALRTFNDEAIATLEKCVEGDVVVMDVNFRSNYREFHRADGSIAGVRSTECTFRNVEVVDVTPL